METLHDQSLAHFTSFRTGGTADTLIRCRSDYDFRRALLENKDCELHVLGYGCNVLISDKGLRGTVIAAHGGNVVQIEDTLVADAGLWWDDVVLQAVDRGLWGLENMSGIPGSVGAAIVGNIAAYGQAIADTLEWVEVINPNTGEERRFETHELGLRYRYSDFQDDALAKFTITRAGFQLHSESIKELTYQSALDAAQHGNYDVTMLHGVRQSILAARAQAGSLWDYRVLYDDKLSRTAGSFFRNPLVTKEQAETLMQHDETGKSAELLRKMNSVHGGDALRVSAAHVLLAAGFTRGQHWGNVRLHPQHVLKIEAMEDATSQNVYDVACEIMAGVKQKLGIDLTPEVRFLGDFS